MPTRLRALTGGLILLAVSPLEAANPAAKDHSLEVLESGIAAINLGNRSRPISYSRTPAGPMFAHNDYRLGVPQRLVLTSLVGHGVGQ